MHRVPANKSPARDARKKISAVFSNVVSEKPKR